MSGFITISRRLFSHDFWVEKREYSRAEAWLDLIRRANWQDAPRLIGNITFDVKRGQLIASEREMASWWGWSQKRVQNFLALGKREEMLSIAKESVGSRITLRKYESYNTAGIAKESEKNQEGIRKESGRNQEGIAEGIKSNNIKNIKQEEKEKQTPPQAGGFVFEKLSKQVGGTCAKLIIEGGVTNLLPNAKKKLFVKWANHKHTSGNEIRTTAVLMEVVKKFQETDLDLLETSISESIGGNYARLVIAKPSAAEKKPLPNYWKPGIEAELKMTPEQTLEYHRQLIALRWYKTTIQGQPYWNRPTAADARTGESSLAQTIKSN